MVWSAQQYLKFETERTRPAADLLAQVPLERVMAGYDLGCGPGNSTELLTERYGVNVITGVDSDADMLEKARLRLPTTEFTKADLATWRPRAKADLLYANAVFQWLPNHMDIFVSLMDHLKPGGVLAVQMPDNRGEPSHLLIEETVASGPWSSAFAGKNLRRPPLPSPLEYFDLLSPKSSHVDIWRTTYHHPMPDAQAIVEWIKGTGLRPYLAAAGEEYRDAFLADYHQRIDAAYPATASGQRLLRFQRLFMIAIRK